MADPQPHDQPRDQPDHLPHYTEYDTRLAAYAVIVREGREPGRGTQVLLALWNEASRPRWTLPGGGVELYESVEQGAVREVKEETGYDVELGELLGVDTAVFGPEQRLTDSERPMKAVRVFYRATITGGELADEVGGSTDEARWFALEEAAGLDRVAMVDVALHLAGIDLPDRE